MNQPKNIEISAFSKILSIWIVMVAVVVITALAAGGQVYWWQRSAMKKEQEQLQQQIATLQNEIKVLKANAGLNKKADSTPKMMEIKDILLKEALADREKTVIEALRKNDPEQLSKAVHPIKGLRFSPYSYVDPKKDLTFSAAQIRSFFGLKKRYLWGYSDENSLPIKLTPWEYYKLYVYDQDYAITNEINYTQASSNSFTTSNCFEVYPRGIVVEFRVSEPIPKDSSDINWRSLRLVFEENNQIWYLVGIIHDQWML